MNKLSVAIITFNEEHHIGRCIDSVLPVADEVIVLDSHSTDNTCAIAVAKGARVVQQTFAGYIEQKMMPWPSLNMTWCLAWMRTRPWMIVYNNLY